MPATFSIIGQAQGSSLANGTVTVTIPAGSNHAALVQVWFTDMTVSGLTCSQGSATVTQHASAAGTIAFRVTGLSAGEAIFTPTGSGSNDITTVAIVSADTDQTTPVAEYTEEAVNNAVNQDTESVTTALDSMAVCIWRGQATWTIVTGDQRGTVSGPAGYNSYSLCATRARQGATTDLTVQNGEAMGRVAYFAFQPAPATPRRIVEFSSGIGGTPVTLLNQPNVGSPLIIR
jgi:hypothetical protein